MKKIMVIDDNVEFLTLMQAWLETEKFEVRLCQDGQIAAEQARSEKPDLIILDLVMPSKPGIEVLGELKMDCSTCHIPVIVLTAASRQPEETELSVRRMAHDIMLKPFDFDQLLTRMCRHLGNSDNASHSS